MSDIEILKLCVGATLANSILIMSAMEYDLETEDEVFDDIKRAIDVSERLLDMLTQEGNDHD